MTRPKSFPEFKSQDRPLESHAPDFAATGESPASQGRMGRALLKLGNSMANRFGADSLPARFFKRLGSEQGTKSPLDQLVQLRQQHSSSEKINLALTIALMVVLVFSWKNFPSLFEQIDQLRNDIREQEKVIEMEQKNNEFLKKLKNDSGKLTENLVRVRMALPDQDEKAEEVISMLENIAGFAAVTVESIGIREIPNSQFYYEDFADIAQVYEYTFSVESGLPNILSFVQSLRQSFRLMDTMTLEIEESKDGYFKAGFSVFAYHLAKKPMIPKI